MHKAGAITKDTMAKDKPNILRVIVEVYLVATAAINAGTRNRRVTPSLQSYEGSLGIGHSRIDRARR